MTRVPDRCFAERSGHAQPIDEIDPGRMHTMIDATARRRMGFDWLAHLTADFFRIFMR
jgi:hypothetical protein